MYQLIGQAVNEEIESTLQEVQDLINLVDVLARATGNFLNSTGGGEADDGKCFSDVSSWLFDKEQGTSFAALRRRDRAQRAAQVEREQYEGLSSDAGGNQHTVSLASTSSNSRQHIQPEFSSLGSSADGQNMASSYYSSQLVSHHIGSHADYKSPRSRYLDNQDQLVMAMPQRLTAFKTPPRSACELVGPITCSADRPEKKLSSGRTVALCGGTYSNVQSYVNKSKSLFGDFASPGNPDYKLPWENKRRDSARSQPITCSADRTEKILSSGRTVALSGGTYSNVQSYVDKSKSLFGDFASPDNPDYKLPWENKRRDGARSQPITCSADRTEKILSSGRTVALSGGTYSNVQSYVDKSKSLFGDFASPDNPDYKLPWESKRRDGAQSRPNCNR